MEDSIKKAKLAAARKKLKQFKKNNLASKNTAPIEKVVTVKKEPPIENDSDSDAETIILNHSPSPVDLNLQSPPQVNYFQYNGESINNVPTDDQTIQQDSQYNAFTNDNNVDPQQLYNGYPATVNPHNAEPFMKVEPSVKVEPCISSYFGGTDTSNYFNQCDGYTNSTSLTSNGIDRNDEVTVVQQTDTANNANTANIANTANHVNHVNEIQNHNGYEQHYVTNNQSGSRQDFNQLSRQIDGLINESETHGSNITESHIIKDLELRNAELATKLRTQLDCNAKVVSQLDDMTSHGTRLQQCLDDERISMEKRLDNDVNELREKLQIHIQTIGILVAEKTELTSSLNQVNKSSEKYIEENDDLTGRLKASRENVNDLEKSLNKIISENKDSSSILQKYEKDVNKLNMEVYQLNLNKEELTNQSIEQTKRLQQKNAECISLNESSIKLSNQLEMSELHIQQLQSGKEILPVDQSKLESLMADKIDLQNTISNYDEMFAAQTTEREQLAQQYEVYVEQLNKTNNDLVQQIDSLTFKINDMGSMNDELQMNIKKINSIQSEDNAISMTNEQTIKDLQYKLDVLQKTKEDFSMELKTATTTNKKLLGDITERETIIRELQSEIVRISDTAATESDQLLSNLQNDKLALSRACSQNRDLKHQLEELQDGFVKISKDNMESLTLFHKEQFICKELSQRFELQENELNEISKIAVDRENSIVLLKKRLEEIRDSDVEDSDINLSNETDTKPSKSNDEMLEKLDAANKTIRDLQETQHNLESQLLRIESTEKIENNKENQHSIDQSSIRQLEAERRELLRKLSDECIARQSAEHKYTNIKKEFIQSQEHEEENLQNVPRSKYEVLQKSMSQLEEKFSQTMRLQADLTDDREKLEHTVLQLQGETDTIGEYVTLYQRQRALLKEQSNARDLKINQMNVENTQVKEKLTHLQSLVIRLIKVRSHTNKNRMINENGSTTECEVNSEDETNTISEDEWPTDSESEIDKAKAEHIYETIKSNGDIEKELLSLCSLDEINNLTDFLNDPRWSYRQCDNCRGPMIEL